MSTDWLTSRRRRGFNRAMQLYRGHLSRMRAMSTPDPTTESGWNAIWGTDVISKDGDSPFKQLSKSEQAKVYTNMAVVFSCVNKIYTAAIEPPLLLGQETDDGWEETTEDHPIKDLLRIPHPVLSWDDVIVFWLMQLFLTGAGYLWESKRDGLGFPSEITPLPTSWVKEAWQGGVLKGYNVKQSGKEGFGVEPEDMVFLKFPDPTHPFGFTGPLQAASNDVQTDQERGMFMLEMMNNAVAPGMAVSQAGGFTPEERKRMTDRLQDVAGRGRRGGGPIFLDSAEGQGKVELLEPLKDLHWPGMANLSETRICSVYGVPPILIGLLSGLEHGTYSNFGQAKTLFVQSRMTYVWRMLERGLTRGLLHNEGFVDLSLRYDLSEVRELQENETEKSTRVRGEFQDGLILRNEARKALDWDPLEEEVGDVYLQKMTTIEIKVDGVAADRSPETDDEDKDTGHIPENDDVEEEDIEKGKSSDHRSDSGGNNSPGEQVGRAGANRVAT